MHVGDWSVCEKNEGISERGLRQVKERVEERISSKWCNVVDEYQAVSGGLNR